MNSNILLMNIKKQNLPHYRLQQNGVVERATLYHVGDGEEHPSCSIFYSNHFGRK